jgi:hypothetical protein
VADELAGVEGNARLTALVGAVLLFAFAIEGVTILDVRGMFALHIFVGLFVVPVVCLKLTTTGYRFLHYYRGTEAYRRKGPPHPVLRITAPLLILATVSTLTTGIVSLGVGPRNADTWVTIHQGSVIAWVATMTIHVLGHALETWRLTAAEVRAKPPEPRRGVRMMLVCVSLVVGLAVGVLSLSWGGDWKNRSDHRRDGAPTEPLVTAQ